MSALLVVGSAAAVRAGLPLLPGARALRPAGRIPKRAPACSGLVVVDDASAETLSWLDYALELRARQPALTVAVLRLVGATDAANTSRGLSSAQALAVMAGSRGAVRCELHEDATRFEYDGA